MTLPKIIMQTWKDTHIPLIWQSSPVSIKKFMPNYTYILSTDADNRKFVSTHFPDFLSTYDNYKHSIQRADAIRYMWLYIHGGIYIDLDYQLLKPLHDLFESNSPFYVVYSKNVGTFVTNSFMASQPRCPFWLDVITEMKKAANRYYFGKHLQVMNTTGPMMLTRVLRRTQIPYTVLPTSSLIPCSVCDLPCKPIGNSYLQVLPGSSWIGFDSRCYNFVLCHWRGLIWILIILFILLILAVIYWSRCRAKYFNTN